MPTTTPVTCSCGKVLGHYTMPDPRPDTTNTINFSGASVQPRPAFAVICKSCQEALLAKRSP